MNQITDARFDLAKPFVQKIILALLVIVCYVNMLGNGYNLDDNLVTQNHPLTSKGIGAIKQIFSSNYYTNSADISFGYRPLTHITFAVEHQFFGEKPLISHFVNLVLFVLCVLLFYNLISQWMASVSYLLPFLAATLFAVHPVHTEVVDSIKNRDELLAFIFMIGSFLSVNKFNKKQSIINWLLITSLFALGMLSKKSIYPMVLILPLVCVFVMKLNLKMGIIILFAMVVPAALIGSGFSLYRMVFMFVAPLITLFLCYGVSRLKILYKSLKKIIGSLPFLIFTYLCLLSVIFYAFYRSQSAYLFLTLPFTIAALRSKKEWNNWLLILCFLLIGFLFSSTQISMLALSIALGYVCYKWNNKRLVKHDIAYLSIGFVIFFISVKLNPGLLIAVFMLGVFFLIANKKAIWALVFSVVVMIVSYLFFKTPFYMYCFFAYAVFVWLNHIKFLLHPKYFVLLLISLTLVYVSFKSQSINQVYQIHFSNEAPNVSFNQKELQPVNDDIFKEGRSLHYIENTLVNPHSSAETMATGLSVLGEYFRLIFFPQQLSFYYGYAKIQTTSFKNVVVWVSLLIHLSLIAIAMWQLKKRPVLSIGIAWYIISVLLFSNWIELVAGMVGERLAFTASAGFFVYIAALFLWLKPDFSFIKPKATEYVFIAVVVLFSVRTIVRNNDWKDALTLMEHDIEHLDQSAYAHHTLGTTLMYESNSNNKLSSEQAGNMQVEAIEHFKKSISIYPYFFNAHFDLARVYISNSFYYEGKMALLQAYKLDSNNLFVLEELAKTSFELKQVEETEKYANQFLSLEVRNENVHEILAYIMMINNRWQDAKRYAERGLQYFPQNNNLKMILHDVQGRGD